MQSIAIKNFIVPKLSFPFRAESDLTIVDLSAPNLKETLMCLTFALRSEPVYSPPNQSEPMRSTKNSYEPLAILLSTCP